MPAHTVAQLEALLGTGAYAYFDPRGTFLGALRQVYPRLVDMGLWRDMAYEVSLSGEYGYVSLPEDTDAVLACTINDFPRNTRSQWHDVRITGRQPAVSGYYGIVDDGFHPVLLDMKDVQGAAESADVTAIVQLDAYAQGTTTPLTATDYAGTVAIGGVTAAGQKSALVQATSGDLRFVTSGATAASVLIDPTGGDNSFIVTADTAGVGGNDITFELLAPAATYLTSVGVVEKAITVTPGTKARLTITGSLEGIDGPITFPELFYTGLSQDGPRYDAADDDLTFAFRYDGFWLLQYGGSDTTWGSPEDVATPDLVTTWTPAFYAVGTPTVTPGVSSAAQVIAAVNADEDAAALITASASGAVTGAVAAVAETLLTGGVDTLGVTSITSISYDDVPAPFDLADPNFPTKVIATVPAGSGVLRFRRFRTSNKAPETTIHLLVKRGAPSNIVAATILHLGNIGALKHGLLGLLAEDNADLERAGYHWGMAGKLLDQELASMFGSAKPSIRIHDPAAGGIRNFY